MHYTQGIKYECFLDTFYVHKACGKKNFMCAVDVQLTKPSGNKVTLIKNPIQSNLDLIALNPHLLMDSKVFDLCNIQSYSPFKLRSLCICVLTRY